MWVLQIAHCYYPPFLDCARQYSVLFKDTPYKVLTVYLTGKEDAEVAKATESDEVIFLGYRSKQVRGLKLNAIAKINDITKQKDFQFCIAHRVKPTYIALLATKLPIISVHHNYNDYTRWTRRLFINRFKSRVLMLGVSNSVRDDLRRDLVGWAPSNIQTLYNRVNVAELQSQLLPKQAARKALNLPDEAYIIGNVGRLHHDKDQATLIKGFARAQTALPADAKLVIIGSGPLEADLKQLVTLLNLEGRVLFTGQINHACQYFKAFDLFVLTSDREPFGMVLLEAMAAGSPIVTTDCGGGAEVVNGVGHLFPFGDVDALALAMQENSRLVENSLVLLAAKKLHDQFSDQAVKEQFWQLDYIKAYTGNKHGK